MKAPAPAIMPHTIVVAGDQEMVEMIQRGRGKNALGLQGVTAVVLTDKPSPGHSDGLWLAVSFPPERFNELTRACEDYAGLLPATAVIHEYMLCLCCGGWEDWPQPVRGLLRALH